VGRAHIRNIIIDDLRDISLSEITPDTTVPIDPDRSKLFMSNAQISPSIFISFLR
jgi:hypothetical protein